MLLSKFNYNATSKRSDAPLSDQEIAQVAPSIFAQAAHDSRSSRYTYIATINVLNGLRKEGFQPFMICQTRVRNEGKREHTKHMIRLRHANQINCKEANEIILLNSHDGSSSYQMLAGVFRFVCQNGLVCGDAVNDIRIPHKGDVVGRVIEGAYSVLDHFEMINTQREGMERTTLNSNEQGAFAKAALVLRYDEDHTPITESQLLMPRRLDDRKLDLWTTFNRVQENLIKGDLPSRTRQGKRQRTRAVTGIDQSIKLNRALWLLAEEMRQLKS